VNKENVQRKLSSIERQKQELSVSLKENQESLEELHKESPTIARKQKEIEKKKKELEDLEIQLKKYYEVRSEIRSTRDRLQDKVSLFNNYKNESGFLLKQMTHFL
jgi:chromosome segregation ATPase